MQNVKSFKLCLLSFIMIIGFAITSLQVAGADESSGVLLEKDVYLESSIEGVESLPDEITFKLYDSEMAVEPVASQVFKRGEYVLDYNFNKSDGLTSGSLARFSINFTNELLTLTDYDTGEPINELWIEAEISKQAIGDRTKLPDEDLVCLLINSNASISTFITFLYNGEDDPIATLYKKLPISLGSEDSANAYLDALLTLASSDDETMATTKSINDPYWDFNGITYNLYYTNGKVGIGTTSPGSSLQVAGSVDNTPDSPGFHMGLSGTYGVMELANTNGGFIDFNPGDGTDFLGRILYSNPTNDMRFYTNAKEVIRINASGKVGIGTRTPGSSLQVAGSVDNTPDSPGFHMGLSGTYGVMELANTNGGFIDFNPGDGTDFLGRILYSNPTNDMRFYTNTSEVIRINSSGKVGIGTTSPSYTLSVKGSIGCGELTVADTSGWADFVFDDDYKLPPLHEIENFILKNNHLPDIPTTEEVQANGINIGTISTKLLQKVEELTLHMIAMKKENESLKDRLITIQNQLDRQNHLIDRMQDKNLGKEENEEI